MRHNGPIHKIAFDFDGDILDYLGFSNNIDNLLGDNLNQWFLLLPQNGVEEIDISSFQSSLCMVPNCIFSCPTLKRLKLSNVCVELVNAYVLPNVTSLDFEYVQFLSENCSDYVVHLPKLEDLSLRSCEDIFYFNIVAAPKHFCLDVTFDYSSYFNPKDMLINFDFGRISSLDLECTYSYFEGLKLNPDDFMLMEGLRSVALTQKMLRTLKFSEFHGWRFEMQYIKLFLACFLGIEKVVITRSQYNRSINDFSIMQELLRFPRASTKAEIFYI
nr:F-box/FBD/LRR-repeat protein At1g13570-like isoform X1 [Ipomoea batatas]